MKGKSKSIFTCTIVFKLSLAVISTVLFFVYMIIVNTNTKNDKRALDFEFEFDFLSRI